MAAERCRTTFSRTGPDQISTLSRSHCWPWVERIQEKREDVAEEAGPQGSAMDLDRWSLL